MPIVHNQEWLDSNTERAYPFKEGSSLSNGEVTLPKDFLLDAVISGTDESIRYRVHYLEILSNTTLQLGISDSAGSVHGVVNLIVNPLATYTVQFFQPVSTSPLRGRFVFGTAAGTGAHELVSTLAVGRYHFGFSSTELEPSVTVPMPDFSKSVTTLSKFGDEERLFYGDVKLQEGSGVSITPDIGTNSFKIDMAKVYNVNCPEDLNEAKRCESCIKRVNGIDPDVNGNFDITGTEFITVETDSSNHKIKVKFAGDLDACCGACDELDELKSKLEELQNTLDVLKSQLP